MLLATKKTMYSRLYNLFKEKRTSRFKNKVYPCLKLGMTRLVKGVNSFIKTIKLITLTFLTLSLTTSYTLRSFSKPRSFVRGVFYALLVRSLAFNKWNRNLILLVLRTLIITFTRVDFLVLSSLKIRY